MGAVGDGARVGDLVARMIRPGRAARHGMIFNHGGRKPIDDFTRVRWARWEGRPGGKGRGLVEASCSPSCVLL